VSAPRLSIAEAIAREGWRSFTVLGAPVPTWRYTVGLTELGLPEVLIAGTAAYGDAALDRVLRAVAVGLRSGDIAPDAQGLGAGDIEFGLVAAHAAWVQRLVLRATKHYAARSVKVVQVVPATPWVDVPRTSVPFDPVCEPVWRWLEEDWTYACDEQTRVLVDIAALRGRPIVEVLHEREPDETTSWTMRVAEADASAESPMRMAPLGTLLALDPTLAATLDLEAGEFATRNSEASGWRAWDIAES
jgi:Domain of unknown function (DUF4262)